MKKLLAIAAIFCCATPWVGACASDQVCLQFVSAHTQPWLSVSGPSAGTLFAAVQANTQWGTTCTPMKNYKKDTFIVQYTRWSVGFPKNVASFWMHDPMGSPMTIGPLNVFGSGFKGRIIHPRGSNQWVIKICDPSYKQSC